MNALILNSQWSANTIYHALARTRQALRYLREHYKAPALDGIVARVPLPKPRNVTARVSEREAILDWAVRNEGFKLFVLLCADLAIRSGTARKLGPDHYDEMRQEFRFTTKWGEKLTLPVTAEIEALLRRCNHKGKRPFVRQLWKNTTLQPDEIIDATTTGRWWRKACKESGVERRITPHDLRRTVAVNAYRHTRNIRTVQTILGHKHLASTTEYLDHDLEEVPRVLLEAIKPSKPFLVKQEQTA